MERYKSPIERRKFLKRGMMSGFLFAFFPVWKAIHTPPEQTETASFDPDGSPDGSHRRLQEIAQKFGGEFGGRKGGL